MSGKMNSALPVSSAGRERGNAIRKVSLNYSWDLFSELEKRFGDLYYILDEQKFLGNVRELREGFQRWYPNTSIAYSYKTNYTPRLCHLAYQSGAYAEVVSKLEYDLALRLGVEPARIIFNGPLKLPDEIESAMLAGSIINLDGPYEIEIVKSVAQKFPERIFEFGLRCNFDLGTGSISRFGFDAAGNGIRDVVRAVSGVKNCSVIGLHCHFSGARSSDLFGRRIDQLLELFSQLKDEAGIRYLDVGGGFYGKMPQSLKEQFGCPIPEYAEYAEAIAGQMARAFPDGSGPELIIEPGIGLLGDVMILIAKIVGLKTVRNKTFAQCTAGIHNIKPLSNRNNLPLTVFSRHGDGNGTAEGAIDIGGYTCMEIDILYRDFKGSLGQGDYLMIENVGAYTNVLTPPFIRTSPPIIAFDHLRGDYRIIKRRESFDDLFSSYVIDGID